MVASQDELSRTWPESATKARLHFVSGKGGTGKSTVAAALALALAEGGKRVVRTAGRDFDQDAFSLSTGFFLTGETPPLSTRTGTWTRPKVANPLGVDGYGAVEVVGRYDTADFTDSLTGGKGETRLLGVNWYPTNNTRVSAHWSAWSVDNRTGVFAGDDKGDTATVRVQTAF